MSFVLEMAELVPLVADVNRRLGLHDDVPPDTEAVLEKLWELLPPTAQLEEEGVDPYLVDALVVGVSRSYRALTLPDAEERASQLRIGLEEVRQALTYMIEERFPSDSRDTAELTAWLLDQLQTSQKEVADLLGVAPRTLYRWMTSESGARGPDAARLQMVARLVANLSHAMTGPGVAIWFDNEHPDLGQPPAALLDSPEAYPTLLQLAARTRSHAAT